MVSWAGKTGANNCGKVKVPSSSVSFKLWGVLDSYSDTVQGTPAHCIVFHSSRFCQEPCGRGGTGKFMRHSRLTPSPTLPCTSSGGGGRSVTKVQSSRAQQFPAGFQELLSSPAQQMETGIILGTTANEGAVKTEDTLQVQHKLQEAEKRREITPSITGSSLSNRDHFTIKTRQHNLLMKHFI